MLFAFLKILISFLSPAVGRGINCFIEGEIMKRFSWAQTARSVLLVLLTLSYTTNSLAVDTQDTRSLEIDSWTFREVTHEYPDVHSRYQDSISMCSEGLDISQNPVASTTLPGAGVLPGTGAATDPADPFSQQTRPPANNQSMYGGGYGGSGGWSPVVDPSIGMGTGNFGNGGIDPNPTTGQSHSGGITIRDLIGLGYAVDVISNMGRRVWDLVNLGKPAAWVNTNVAHGLPKGIKCWTDLQGWSWPQSKIYNVSYKNKLGVTVVDYTYRISYNYGGNIEGVGKFLSNVQIVPVNIKVSWGYSLNSRAEVPTVFNVGSKQDPIAGMQVNVRWKVESSMNSNEQSHMFHIGGNNLFQKVE